MFFCGAAGLSFLVGGRALHEFAGIDRMLGEMDGIALAAGLGGIAALLHEFAERIKDHDDGQPVTLAISDVKEKEGTRRDISD